MWSSAVQTQLEAHLLGAKLKRCRGVECDAPDVQTPEAGALSVSIDLYEQLSGEADETQAALDTALETIRVQEQRISSLVGDCQDHECTIQKLQDVIERLEADL